LNFFTDFLNENLNKKQKTSPNIPNSVKFFFMFLEIFAFCKVLLRIFRNYNIFSGKKTQNLHFFHMARNLLA